MAKLVVASLAIGLLLTICAMELTHSVDYVGSTGNAEVEELLEKSKTPFEQVASQMFSKEADKRMGLAKYLKKHSDVSNGEKLIKLLERIDNLAAAIADDKVNNCDLGVTKEIANGIWPILSEYSDHKELSEYALTILVDHLTTCGHRGQYWEKFWRHEIFDAWLRHCGLKSIDSGNEKARVQGCLDSSDDETRSAVVDYCTGLWTQTYGALADILLLGEKGTKDIYWANHMHVTYYCGFVAGQDGDYVHKQLVNLKNHEV